MNKVKLLKIFLAGTIILPLYSCSLAKYGINYTQTAEPRFAALDVIHHKSKATETIKVVTYNIMFSKKIDEAIKLLSNDENLKDADVIFLQEMDDKGVAKIAQEMEYNYVYYPAVFHPIPKQNFGNAILSKWPIIGDQKIILPSTKKKLQRIAASATLLINEKKVMVFSIHMRISVKPFMRTIQISRIENAIPKDINHVIIAGDFNSFTQLAKFAIIDPLKRKGFELATEDIGWTHKHWYILNKKSALDHIFTKGMENIVAGKVLNRTASDHIPVWATMELK